MMNVVGTEQRRDVQVFEYTDTLSLLVPTEQRHLKAGDPVVINKDGLVAGVLVSDVVPAPKQDAWAARDVFNKPTYGNNRVEGYASVRVKGGVFTLTVDATGSTTQTTGTPVYLKAATDSGEPTLTLKNSSSDVILGWLYAPLSAATGKQIAQVVLDVRKVDA